MGIMRNMGLVFDRDKFDLSKPLIQRQRPKINSNIGQDCFDAYDCFLRTQIFNDVDSNLIKNLESSKRKEIESFRNYDAIYNIEKMIHQTRTAFHDAKRQKKAMEKILAGYDEHDRTITHVTQQHADNCSEQSNIEPLNLEIKSPVEELKELNLNPLNDEPVVVMKSKRENFDGSMKPVTDFAGSKGPKWVAMYQPPYKQLYHRSLTKNKSKLMPKTIPRAKGVVRAADLINNDLNSEIVLPVR